MKLLKLLQNLNVLLTFDKVHNPLRLPHKTTSERPKVVRDRQFFYTFDLEMCFAPHPRALFWHLNFQKWSEHVVFLTCSLGNMLRATTANASKVQAYRQLSLAGRCRTSCRDSGLPSVGIPSSDSRGVRNKRNRGGGSTAVGQQQEQATRAC